MSIFEPYGEYRYYSEIKEGSKIREKERFDKKNKRKKASISVGFELLSPISTR